MQCTCVSTNSRIHIGHHFPSMNRLFLSCVFIQTMFSFSCGSVSLFQFGNWADRMEEDNVFMSDTELTKERQKKNKLKQDVRESLSGGETTLAERECVKRTERKNTRYDFFFLIPLFLKRAVILPQAIRKCATCFSYKVFPDMPHLLIFFCKLPLQSYSLFGRHLQCNEILKTLLQS